MKAKPDSRHVVTFRDPRDFQDWKMEFDLPSLNKLQVVHNYFYENNILVRNCIKKMNAVFTIGKYLVPKVKSMYHLEIDPIFLPTPVHIPETIRKSDAPTVCYVARLDRRKRPKLFLDLARKFPDVHFIAMGKSRDRKWEAELRAEYSNLENLEMTGFVDQFGSDLHSKILEKSWIMVNTATREALPNSFIEASAHQCAILSSVDPDGFASVFGHHAGNDDFSAGLSALLNGGAWKERGRRGYEYVKETFEIHRAIDRHIAFYEQVLTG